MCDFFFLKKLAYVKKKQTNICCNFEGTDIASNPTSKLRSPLSVGFVSPTAFPFRKQKSTAFSMCK